MFCNKCGKQIHDEAKVCSYCGAIQNAGKEQRRRKLLSLILAVLIGIAVLVISITLFLLVLNKTILTENHNSEIEDEQLEDDEDIESEDALKENVKEDEITEEMETDDEDVFNSDIGGKYTEQVTVNQISMTKEEVKVEESRIREQVNSGNATVRVDYAAGQDGCVWKRRYEFENGKLIFAYYSDATNGALDQRYYFKDDCLIEWIPYTGNGAPDEYRHFVSDTPLVNGWYEEQERVLQEAYGEDSAGEVISEANIKQLVNEMEGYELYVLWNHFDFIEEDKSEITINLDARQKAIAAGSTVDVSISDSQVISLEDLNAEYCFLDEEQIVTAGKNLFGETVSCDDLKEYDEDFGIFDIRKLNGYPIYVYTLYETEVDYAVHQINIIADNNRYKVIKTTYYGYWGENDGHSNFEIEYDIVPDSVSKYGVVIDSMRIRSLGK